MQATIESGLDCISDDEFAWSDGGGLRAMNVSSGQVYPLWKPKTGQIVEATFSRQLNKFLITCKENQRYSLWQLKRNANGQDKVKQLASDDDIQNAQWLAGGDGFAYLKDHKLVIKTEIESQRGELASAEISHFICSTNDNLFFIGTVGNLPWDGLWCYNLASGTLTNVVSYTEKPSPYATAVYPHHWSAWWRGKALNYYIYYPAHFDRRKKYPLILGDSSLLVPNGLYVSNPHGPNWAEAIANCGAFVAFVYRPNWWWGLNKWDSDVQAFYEYLTRDPTIEKDKVFLFGTSAETGYMSRLIEERPELWKGAIFLNPGVLPNLSAVESGRRAPRILISAGAEEEGAEYFKKFQNEACSHGIAVEIQELPETGHYLVSTSAGLARTRAMVDFIFNN
ncbi:MAG TPA: hypothetical protein VH280_12755 [Verrucomicrobiae bacterium]|nr:hypothetical protein [Verrucomicrobiae bacterium]